MSSASSSRSGSRGGSSRSTSRGSSRGKGGAVKKKKSGKGRRRQSVVKRRSSRKPSFISKKELAAAKLEEKLAEEAAAVEELKKAAALKRAEKKAKEAADKVIVEIPLAGFASASKGSVYITCQRELVGIALARGDKVKVGEFLLTISKDPSLPCAGSTFAATEPFPGETAGNYEMVKLVSVPNAKARRPSFLEELQSSMHVDEVDLGDGGNRETYFRVECTWSDMEPFLGSIRDLSKTQESMVEVVPPEFVLAQIFLYLCQLKPAADMLDGSKWAKFCRDCPGLVDRKVVKPTDVDITFAKCKEKGQRRVTMPQFQMALGLIAMARYPALALSSEAAAVEELMRVNVCAWDKANAIIWREARRMAIQGEARQQAACTRLGAIFRGCSGRWLYHSKLDKAMLIQRVFRAFLERSDFLQKLQLLRDIEEKRKEEVRQRRRARKEALLYREGRTINGHVNIVTIYRYSKKDIFIRVYNPLSCELFTFTLTRDDIRTYLERAMGRGSLSINELYFKVHMRILADQLVYKRRRGVRVIMLSRHGKGQRGKALMKRGYPVSGRPCVVGIYKYYRDYLFHAYDMETCETFNTILKLKQLYKWFGYDPMQPVTPELLQLANEEKLLRWFLDHLFICRGCALGTHRDRHNRGENVLMLEYEREEQRDHVMAAKLQGMWRAKKCRDRMRDMIRACYQKQFDASSQAWYYCNLRTGAVHWSKPYNLGSEDLPDPPDRWDQQPPDENGDVYYFHALTGRYSRLSEDQAATQLQRLFRSSKCKDFRVADLGILAKAVRFQREAKENFFKQPDRLSSIVNYALLNHCVELNWDLARELFGQAIERAPQNPMLLTCKAIFQIAACIYPRKHTFDQAVEHLALARVMDPNLEKFEVARGAFFHFAIVMEPDSPKTLLNWAVLKQCVDRDYDKAEQFYRRALEVGPNDSCVTQNFADFCENRLPGGLYAGGGPGNIARRRAQVVKDGANGELSAPEWCELYDGEAANPLFARFYFNRKTDTTRWDEPDWDKIWEERREASGDPTQRIGIWDEYLDAGSGNSFYFSFAQGKYQWEMPYNDRRGANVVASAPGGEEVGVGDFGLMDYTTQRTKDPKKKVVY